MIIGISGKIGSGKDTVGAIIRHLVAIDKGIAYSSKEEETTMETFRKTGMLPINVTHVTGWEIKKFAKKLKEMVVLLTGCNLEDLERQEFKDSNLPPEWDEIVMGGKTNPSFELAEEFGYNFDQLLKDNVAPTERQKIKETCLNKARESGWEQSQTQPDVWKQEVEVKRIPRTYRWLLQQLGTEAIRNTIHTNAWVNALFADYKPIYVAGIDPIEDEIKSEDIIISNFFPNWIITDMRFPNEMKGIKDRKGITIRINRNWAEHTGIKSAKEVVIHPSETALDNATFDYTIENNGTMEELIEKVKQILIKEQILQAA